MRSPENSLRWHDFNLLAFGKLGAVRVLDIEL